MPGRPANRQSAAITRDGPESNRPRAERAIYRDVDHPTSPVSPSMLAERHPCRSRIASAFPRLEKVGERTILGCDQRVTRGVKIVSQVDGRRPRMWRATDEIHLCEAAPHSAGSAYAGPHHSP